MAGMNDDISTWTEADLDALISNKVQESLTLDYKRSDALVQNDHCKRELSKDVSAFANSAGGLIVYGIEETQHLPTGVDAGADPSVITREWIENVIEAGIHPRVQGLLIKAVPLASGRVAYAIRVPAATTEGPHQASDFRYYRRRNYQSVPMDDYEIRDIRNRAITPKLELQWKIVRARPFAEGDEDYIEGVIELTVSNRSPTPALYTSCAIYIDTQLSTSQLTDFSGGDIIHLKADGQRTRLFRRLRHFAVPQDPPFFREQDLSIGRMTFRARPSSMYYVGHVLSTPGFSGTRMGRLVFMGPNHRFEWIDEAADYAIQEAP